MCGKTPAPSPSTAPATNPPGCQKPKGVEALIALIQGGRAAGSTPDAFHIQTCRNPSFARSVRWDQAG